MRGWNCGGFIIGICALALGLGILIAAVFPVGCLMFLVAFLLIACGIACLKNRRSRHEDRCLEVAAYPARPAAQHFRDSGITGAVLSYHGSTTEK